MVLHLIFEGLHRNNYLIRKSGFQCRNPNSVSNYQKSFYQKFCFISLLILAKSSALFVPLVSSELGSEQLCPNPIDFQRTPFFPYFPMTKRVYVLKLSRPLTPSLSPSGDEGPEVQSPLPCHFTTQGDNGRERMEVVLVTLEQRRTLLNFDKKCRGILEFADIRGQGSGMTCETEEVNHEEDKTIVASDGKFEIRITQKKIVKLMTRRIQFELPYEGPSGYYPYLTALFRILSEKGECYIQVQQYYWTSWSNDSSKCSDVLKDRLRHHICGHFECSDEVKLIKLLKENGSVSSGSMALDGLIEGRGLPPVAKMRTIGYFLKGLLLPLLISISATLGYLIWRRRAKHARLVALRAAIDGMPVSLGTQTQSASSALGVFPVFDEHGNLNLIELEDDYMGEGGEMARQKPYSQDMPPTYASIIEPPSYAEATQRLLPQIQTRFAPLTTLDFQPRPGQGAGPPYPYSSVAGAEPSEIVDDPQDNQDKCLDEDSQLLE